MSKTAGRGSAYCLICTDTTLTVRPQTTNREADGAPKADGSYARFFL